MKANEVVILAEGDDSWVQGHACDSGEHFEFFDIYFGNNSTMISLTLEEFEEIVNLFREIIDNEEKDNLSKN